MTKANVHYSICSFFYRHYLEILKPHTCKRRIGRSEKKIFSNTLYMIVWRCIERWTSSKIVWCDSQPYGAGHKAELSTPHISYVLCRMQLILVDVIITSSLVRIFSRSSKILFPSAVSLSSQAEYSTFHISYSGRIRSKQIFTILCVRRQILFALVWKIEAIADESNK